MKASNNLPEEPINKRKQPIENAVEEAQTNPSANLEELLKEVQAIPYNNLEEMLRRVPAKFSTNLKKLLKEAQANPSANLEKLLRKAQALPSPNLEGLLKKAQTNPSANLEELIEESQAENKLGYLPDQIKEMQKTLNSLRLENDHQRNKLSETLKTIEETETKAKDLNKSINEELNKVKELYETKLKMLNEKEKEVNNLMGTIGKGVIAHGFEENANKEETAADWLRKLSGGIMLFVIIAITYSIVTTDFNWQQSLFRVIFSLLLSVPAAYFAKESAKHRQQQYHYRQTSLDLKAINPYIASLKEEDQMELKKDLSKRLFAVKEFEVTEDNSYPLDTQALLIALINKLELPTGNKSNNPCQNDTQK